MTCKTELGDDLDSESTFNYNMDFHEKKHVDFGLKLRNKCLH